MKFVLNRTLLVMVLSCGFGCFGFGQATDLDLQSLEQQSLYSAATEAAKHVVKVETIGGAERVDGKLISSAPTSGVIVGEDGYIVSSAYAFIQKPNSILVELPNGKRESARIVSRDNRFRLVLLKVDVDEPLPVPEAIAENTEVGQWAITVARTLPGEHFNMSVGIVSAKDRVWGRAVQVDANVSPANYGGALVDIQGQIVGVLVPLSPDSNEVVAGTEWYDSGIGFAVPLRTIMARLEEWKNGDLNPGLIGIAMKSSNMYGSEAIIGVCRPNSPAREADLRADDTVIEANGRPITRYAELKTVLGPLTAGETVRLKIRRGEEELEKTVELIDKLLPYEHAFLGILPAELTPAVPDEIEAETEIGESKEEEEEEKEVAEQKGVTIRYVFDNSPASDAGLKVGDILTKVASEATIDELMLRQVLAAYEPNQELEISYVRNEESQSASVKLSTISELIPVDVPARYGANAADDADLPPLGKIDIQLPEEANKCTAYIPETYDPQFDHAMLVLLPAPGEKKIDEIVRTWREQCDRSRTILLIPQANDNRSWERTETKFIRKTIDNVKKDYAIDADRVVLVGADSSGSMAFLTSFAFRDLVRGVASLRGAVPRRGQTIFNEPLQRLSFWFARPEEGRIGGRLEMNAELLRKLKFPVAEKITDSEEFDDEIRASIFRWIDGLDRI